MTRKKQDRFTKIFAITAMAALILSSVASAVISFIG